MRHLATLAIGLVFGLGISVSGMANPAVVLGFFDVAGDWDPRLAFVMGGALAVTAIGYRFVLARSRPVFEPAFDIPTNRTIDVRLIGGSATFGVGWGLTGFCPGAAIPALGTFVPEVALFLAAMIAGLLLARTFSGGFPLFRKGASA